jgi:hypothetical protein
MRLYYKNTYVAWEGAGWYILKPQTPNWKSQWEKAESLDELDHASAKKAQTAYLTKSICENLEDK